MSVLDKACFLLSEDTAPGGIKHNLCGINYPLNFLSHGQSIRKSHASVQRETEKSRN